MIDAIPVPLRWVAAVGAVVTGTGLALIASGCSTKEADAPALAVGTAKPVLVGAAMYGYSTLIVTVDLRRNEVKIPPLPDRGWTPRVSGLLSAADVANINKLVAVTNASSFAPKPAWFDPAEYPDRLPNGKVIHIEWADRTVSLLLPAQSKHFPPAAKATYKRLDALWHEVVSLPVGTQTKLPAAQAEKEFKDAYREMRVWWRDAKPRGLVRPLPAMP